VDVIPPSGKEYFANAPAMFGGYWIDESAAQPEVKLRSATECKVLFLYESDFQSAMNNFNSEKRKTALILLARVPVFQNWN